MGCLDKVCFDFSLARGLDYYTGLIYEIVLLDKEKDLGAISGGGRYDDLIGMFSQQQIPAVGGSMGIERLFSILETR
jgi:histidyl-tRNA synthetase